MHQVLLKGENLQTYSFRTSKNHLTGRGTKKSNNTTFYHTLLMVSVETEFKKQHKGKYLPFLEASEVSRGDNLQTELYSLGC